MVASTVKNGTDLLRKGNRLRRRRLKVGTTSTSTGSYNPLPALQIACNRYPASTSRQ